MSKIFLNAYDPDNHNQGYKKWPVYTLNIDSNTVDIIYFDSYQDTKSIPQAGMGDFRKIGAQGSKKNGFFAVYVHNNSLYLWLDGRCFDLINEGTRIVISRSVDFLLRKCFRVFYDDTLIFKCRYSYLDYENFPDIDIFWYMARSLNDIENRLRVFFIWQIRLENKYARGDYFDSAGYDAYIRDLDARVAAKMKNI